MSFQNSEDRNGAVFCLFSKQLQLIASDTEIWLIGVWTLCFVMAGAAYLKHWLAYILYSRAEERLEKNSLVLDFRKYM
jgi:hypothetical protein